MGDLVVLSNVEYERLSGKAELHRLLDAGIAAKESGSGRPAEDVFADIERTFNFNQK